MADRIGRIVHDAIGDSRTPHLAVSEVPGAGMLLAGNSGKKRLSAADQDAGTNHLLGVGALGKPQPLKSGGDPRISGGIRRSIELCSRGITDEHIPTTQKSWRGSPPRWSKGRGGSTNPRTIGTLPCTVR